MAHGNQNLSYSMGGTVSVLGLYQMNLCLPITHQKASFGGQALLLLLRQKSAQGLRVQFLEVTMRGHLTQLPALGCRI